MKILGYNYTVVQEARDIGAAGRCEHGKQIIQIAPGQTKQQVESTILHEIIEALNYHLGLEIEHNSIMALEAGLYQVLTDAQVGLEPLVAKMEGKDG